MKRLSKKARKETTESLSKDFPWLPAFVAKHPDPSNPESITAFNLVCLGAGISEQWGSPDYSKALRAWAIATGTEAPPLKPRVTPPNPNQTELFPEKL